MALTMHKGHWQFQVANNSRFNAPVEFKMDKRSQLADYAVDWANYYQSKNIDSFDHPWNSIVHPDGLFGLCWSFASHIYNRHGLSIVGTDSEMYLSATAPDNDKGSLRFFWTKEAVPTPITCLLYTSPSPRD